MSEKSHPNPQTLDKREVTDGFECGVTDGFFDLAYTEANEEGKADTTGPAGCYIASNTPVTVKLSTERRKETFGLNGSTIIPRQQGERTLQLSATIDPTANVEKKQAQGQPIFEYRAHYVDPKPRENWCIVF
ncbi:hypothetical protein H1R20_g15503, partial [Candolleomyces eurysporus]